ncbi:TonB-dependent receptor [Pedobacter alpinus]|uniref:TonB-dependent receptor n=2 Tax=Pedobacter alpinus TaxID=1590643 RepID=A0ABW5TPJ7_9SPHI
MLIALLSFSQQLYSQNCNYTFFGNVYDNQTKTLLPGAFIKLAEKNLQTVTDYEGHFHFENLCAGDYTVEISFLGYQKVIRKITIAKNLELNFFLKMDDNALNEVVITEKKIIETPTQTRSVLTGINLELTKGASLGEALKKIPGLTSLQTGPSISKPAIHGMHSNRVLIYNAGVRQEGQQWGVEHAPEIDPLIADQIIVLKGASAVAYGSDAIAGVILVEPKPLQYQSGFNGEVNLVGGSNNGQALFNTRVENSSKNWSWRAYLTSQIAGNAKTPDYYLDNTGFQQFNGAVMAGYQKNKFGFEVYASNFITKIGVFSGAQIGSTTDLQNAINGTRPLPDADFGYEIDRPYQQVSHSILKLKAFKLVNMGKLELQYSFQQNNREEYDQIRASQSKSYQLRFELSTHNLDFHLDHSLSKNIKGKIGYNAIFQQNFYDGRYLVPFFNSLANGVYATEKYVGNKFEIEAGLRFDYKYMVARLRENPNVSTSPEIRPEFNFSQFSASLGGNYQIGSAVLANFTFSKGWRPPSINELFSFGTHQGSGTFEIGDRNLKEESALNFATGLKKEQGKFTFDVNAYLNLIDNYIYLKPGTELILTSRGAYPTFNYKQVNARFTGIDFLAGTEIVNSVELQAKYSMVRAIDRAKDTFLEFIPADQYGLSAIWNIEKIGKLHNSTVNFGLTHTNRQNRVLQSQDYAATPPAYTLFSADVSTKITLFKKEVGFSLTVQNLTNLAYRNYLNRFRYFADEQGRNFIFRIKIPF